LNELLLWLMGLAPGKRRSVARERAVVLHLPRGEAAVLLSRELAVPICKLEKRRPQTEAVLHGALEERVGDPANVALAGCSASKNAGATRLASPAKCAPASKPNRPSVRWLAAARAACNQPALKLAA